MNNEIPVRITIAPIAIKIALVPLKPLLVEEVVGVETTGGAVVVGVVGAACCGRPGTSGLVGP